MIYIWIKSQTPHDITDNLVRFWGKATLRNNKLIEAAKLESKLVEHMTSRQADRGEVRTETEAKSAADDIAKAWEEHEHEQKNDGSIIQSIIGAVKSTLGNAENTAAEKTSNPEERLEETTELAGENGDDEDEDYNTAQFACTWQISLFKFLFSCCYGSEELNISNGLWRCESKELK